MKKIKILHSGETSGAFSGFGKYGKEVLSRLHQNDRFELAEIASFGCIEDDKWKHVKWKYYPNMVNPGHPEFDAYNSNPANALGAWRFDRVLLDFKPDFVYTIRDPWNDIHVAQSPFRKFFNFAWMPTVDSAPQQVQWIEMFKECDAIFTYSDWAIPVLKQQSGDDVKPICSAYPGVHLDVFKPRNKKELRRKYGLPEDAFIIGMTSRNQIRKLFPELLKAFRIYLDKYGETEVGKKTYLYLHTSYPEGWDLPSLLNESGLADRVLFSYVCSHTRQPFIAKFEGALTHSFFSNGLTGHMPNVAVGYTEEQLSEIYNLFDLYVQYSNCEGAGMGQMEAAACGIPIAATYYSAMADVVDKTQGIPLYPAAIPRDFMMQADRADPDNDAAADAFFKFLSLDENYRQKKSKQARQAAEKYFNWDVTAKIWSDYFENTTLTGLQGKWDSPIQIQDFNIPNEIPPNMSNAQFIQWVTAVVAKRPELAWKFIGLDWLKMLNYGPSPQGHLTQQNIFQQCQGVGQSYILHERARVGMEHLTNPDFIEFAHVIEKHNNE